MKHNVDQTIVISMYESGLSIYNIADKLNIGKSTVHRIIKENNVSKPEINKSYNPTKTHLNICKYYLDGNSALATAVKYNISPSQIYRILDKNNIKRRSLSKANEIAQQSSYTTTPRKCSINKDDLHDMYVDKKMTAKEISNKLNINYNTINYYLNKYGIKRNHSDMFAIKSRISKELWKNEKFKNNMGLAISSTPKVSSLQEILYSLLDDLGVKYYREYNDKTDDKECTIGPYSFDCVIPRDNQPDLLIECQGEYWHSLHATQKKDVRKASYISNNFNDIYELRYLFEHEFYNRNYILSTLKQWLGIEAINIIDFSFNEVKIEKSFAHEYKLLLAKYHYLSNAGRGGIAYGAYIANELIAVCIFSPLIRQNIGDNESTRELSRFCINPKYQKKNFASWFISRCLKSLPVRYKNIIAYCDTTFGHNGTIYKASNFKFHSNIKPDYWYRKDDGWIMHKRTLYGKARSIGMIESEYAKQHSYHKVWGNGKKKYIFNR